MQMAKKQVIENVDRELSTVMVHDMCVQRKVSLGGADKQLSQFLM